MLSVLLLPDRFRRSRRTAWVSPFHDRKCWCIASQFDQISVQFSCQAKRPGRSNRVDSGGPPCVRYWLSPLQRAIRRVNAPTWCRHFVMQSVGTPCCSQCAMHGRTRAGQRTPGTPATAAPPAMHANLGPSEGNSPPGPHRPCNFTKSSCPSPRHQAPFSCAPRAAARL